MRALCFCLALALPLAAAAEDWKALEGGDFTVSFPGDAAHSEREDETQSGKVKSQEWTLEQEHQTFTLSVADYSPEAVKKLMPAKMLAGARDGAVAHLGGTLDKDTAVFLEAVEPKKKWPGREFSLHTPQGTLVNGRIFLVANKLYMLLGLRDATVKEEADFTRFADSLKLKGEAKPEGKPEGKSKKTKGKEK